MLIESKGQAAFQPGQADRYRTEVLSARARLGERRAAAILVGLEATRYVRDGSGDRVFDADVLVEAIVSFMEARTDEVSETAEGAASPRRWRPASGTRSSC